MDLSDLDSTDLLLALDLVAEWQLDHVRGIKLWDQLENWGEGRGGDGAVNNRCIIFIKELPVAGKRRVDFGRLAVEIETRGDQYILATWREQDNTGLNDLIEVPGGTYDRVPCSEQGFPCVCLLKIIIV